MPYFTLDYLRPSSPSESPSFIIIEKTQPLNVKKLKELNKIAQFVLNNHSTCAHVPASFPLHNDLHRNTLILMAGVVFEAVKNIRSLFTTPATKIIIDSLQETIDLCLSVENPLAFEQELPIIMDTSIPMETPSITTSFSQATAPHPQKRAASPLKSHSPSKQSRIDSVTNTFESFFQDNSLILLENIETDLTPIMSPIRSSYTPLQNLQLSIEELLNDESYKTSSPTLLSSTTEASYSATSYILPIIYTLEDTKRFTIEEQVVTDLSGYLFHLHEGIYHVLDNSFYFLNPTDPIDTYLSKLSLHNSSLLKLLQLLYKQQSLIGLISDDHEKLILEGGHLTLIQDIEGNLREAGFSSESLNCIYNQCITSSKKDASRSDSINNPIGKTSSPSTPNPKENTKLKLLTIDIPTIKKDDTYLYYLLPMFCIKKYYHKNDELSFYHLSYCIKYNLHLNNLKRCLTSFIQILITNINFILLDSISLEDFSSMKIFFNPYNILNTLKKNTTQLSGKKEVLQHLHEGLIANLSYYQKRNLSFLTLEAQLKIIESIKHSINKIEKLAVNASIILPNIITHRFFDNMLMDIITNPNNLDTKLPRIIREPTLSSMESRKPNVFHLPFFIIHHAKWVSSAINKQMSMYTLKYYLKTSLRKERTFTYESRSILMSIITIATLICESDNVDNRFQEMDPETMQTNIITKGRFLTLLYQGLEQNLFFLQSQSQFSKILKKSKKCQPQESIYNVLSIIKLKIGYVQSNPHPYQILSQMLSNARQKDLDQTNLSDLESQSNDK